MVTLSFKIPNDVTHIRVAVDQIEDFGHKHGVPTKPLCQLALSIDELLTNIISYAFDEPQRQKKNQEIEISVELQDKAHALCVQISDQGRAFDPLTVKDPDVSSPLERRALGGLGIHLAKSMVDEIAYKREQNHNILKLIKNYNSK